MSLHKNIAVDDKVDRQSASAMSYINACPVVFEKNSPYSFVYYVKGEKRFPMQSLRGPEDEAQRIVSNWLKGASCTQGLYILLGITNMYLIVEFLSKLDKHSELIIIEPSKEVLNSFMANNDLDILNEQEAKFSLISDFPEKLPKTFRILINSRTNFCTDILVSPANSRFRPELLELKEQLTIQVKLEALDRVTTAKFADEWLQNCLINLPELLNSPGVKNFYNSFQKTDCFVVCAGPSLNDSIELIKEKQNDCFIICVGTALKPLINAGVQPDITIVVDSDPKVYKQFEGLNKIGGYLLGTHTLFPGIYQHFQNKSICFSSIASSTFSDWLIDGNIDHGCLNVGGTVALSALDCAISFSFRNIFVFGLDLAYAEDGTSHAKNSMYDGHRAQTGLIEIPGNWNKKVKTTKQFAHYVEILNGYLAENISRHGNKFYNVNKSGAQFKHLDVINPEQAAELIQPANEDFKSILKEKFIKPERADVNELCESSLTELQKIKSDCDSLLKEMDSGQYPEELEQFETFLKESKVNNSLTGPALQAWCMNLSSQAESDPFEMTKSFLTQLSGATEWVEGLLKNSYERFLNQKKGVR